MYFHESLSPCSLVFMENMQQPPPLSLSFAPASCLTRFSRPRPPKLHLCSCISHTLSLLFSPSLPHPASFPPQHSLLHSNLSQNLYLSQSSSHFLYKINEQKKEVELLRSLYFALQSQTQHSDDLHAKLKCKSFKYPRTLL